MQTDTIELQESELLTEVPALSAKDLCDATASGAETASVRVIGTAGQILDLCKHHFEQNEAALLISGYRVFEDARDNLTVPILASMPDPED